MRKNSKNFDLKAKLGNILMISGKKKTGEKILLKSVKRLQKSIGKNLRTFVQLSIVNTTSTFKLNEQVVKKGKRKAVRVTPSFIPNDSLRLTTSLKFLKMGASKNRKAVSFYEKFTDEILASFTLKGHAVEKKNEVQKEILTNKRYLSKFRW